MGEGGWGALTACETRVQHPTALLLTVPKRYICFVVVFCFVLFCFVLFCVVVLCLGGLSSVLMAFPSSLYTFLIHWYT